ncbi:EamA family transporter [Pseudomonas aeruginosa]|uniref:DMT family transporter n=1 Tax=Pseudomonas aeruginosa TaxID=287 RepID=UPI00071C0D6C|nr:DMT family transporter [Pseudomonas aeruginosa]KSF09044.1 EamA family transporter [Pseudomonas aeruginosa]MDC3945713.1 DMT family transporter [Pseudomonas aeruginosa]
MSSRHLAQSCLALAMLLVGSTVVVSKLLAHALDPFLATALRLALALPCFLILLRLSGQRWPRLGARDGCLLLAQAAAGSVGYTVLLIVGLRYTSAADAGVILGALPLVAASLSILLLGERPSRRLLAALALASAGVAAITLEPGGPRGAWLGNLLVLLAVGCEALFILLNKALRTAVPALPLSTAMSALGLLLSLPLALPALPSLATVPLSALLAVLYYALLPTVAGFLLWYAGASRVSASEASLFTALLPVSALLAAALAGETVSVRQLCGLGCVLLALLAVLLPNGRRRGPG